MREWPLKIIHYVTGFLILSSMHCLFASLAAGGDKNTFIYSFIYLPIVILFSEVQERAKHSWQFLLLAGVGIVFVYFVSRNPFDQKMSMILTVMAAISYFYARASKKKCWIEEPIYPFLVLYIMMILLEMKYESILLKNYAVYGAGIYYLLCMYKNNLDEMRIICDAGTRLERFPMKRLFQSNYVMMGFQTIVVALGMCVASIIGMDGALSKMMQMVRKGIAWLLSGLESEELVGTGEATGEAVQMAAVQTKELSAFMEILRAIGEFLGWIVVIGITLYAIFKLLKKCCQLYLAFDINSEENGDQIEQLYVVKSKDEKKILKKQKRETLFWDRSPNSRIRKIYRKRVLRDWKEIPDASMTPTEIEEKVAMNEKEKYLFHILYEKARYGEDSCTKEEASAYKY